MSLTRIISRQVGREVAAATRLVSVVSERDRVETRPTCVARFASQYVRTPLRRAVNLRVGGPPVSCADWTSFPRRRRLPSAAVAAVGVSALSLKVAMADAAGSAAAAGGAAAAAPAVSGALASFLAVAPPACFLFLQAAPCVMGVCVCVCL
jgi:hypothetical protein